MNYSFEEYVDAYATPMYGAIKKMKIFKVPRKEMIAIALVKMGELWEKGESSEKIIHYRVLEHLDNEIARNISVVFPFHVSIYHLMTYRSLLRDVDDVHPSEWTKEWIMSKSYRGAIKEERAELMLELARFKSGGGAPLDHIDLEIKAKKKDSYAEYDWLKKYCNSEKEKLILDTIITKEPSITEISRITGIPKGTVNGFLRRFRKRLKADGITSLHITGKQ